MKEAEKFGWMVGSWAGRLGFLPNVSFKQWSDSICSVEEPGSACRRSRQ